MKPFIKEVLYDAGILLGLVVLPLAFIGPNGFASKLGHSNSTTHGEPLQSGSEWANVVSSETNSSEERKEKEPDRFIPILHAFRRPADESSSNGSKS